MYITQLHRICRIGGDNLEIYKNTLFDIIKEVEQQINEFKENLSNKKEELPNISEIKKQLGLIEKVTKELRKICDNIVYIMDVQLDKMSGELNILLKNNCEIMFETIDKNLPNRLRFGMIEDTQNGKYAEIIENNLDTVGYVKIEETDGKIVAEITIQDEKPARFEITHPLRMMSIASYINLKYNYEQNGVS